MTRLVGCSNRVRFSLASISVVILMVAAMVVPSWVNGQNTPPAAPPALDKTMSAMNRAYRKIKAQASDKAQNEATLSALTEMQTATVTAKSLVPDTVSSLSGADKAKKLTDYRMMIVKLLRQELDLEEQVLSGNNDKAAAIIAAMDDTQKQGHTAFRPPEP